MDDLLSWRRCKKKGQSPVGHRLDRHDGTNPRETPSDGYHAWVHLATDYIHPTPRRGRCRIRLYLPEEDQDATVVICSEWPANEGSSR